MKYLDYSGLQYYDEKLKQYVESSLEQHALPVASTTQLGGVKVGDGLEITHEGVLNCIIDPGSGTVSWGNISGKPTFATVATSGSYNDLSDKPSIYTPTVNAASGTKTIWTGTQSEYEAVTSKDANTLYFITEG